ncbi:suppressor of G2 allele of SKP1 [Klebsormidium nitens]|uniref:Suppressor of G2 allele of SKP1 n=1 Tax=Klebsormidium nitens TaxID=105231 RepID=A0A1Y1IMF6_KLENI|nr:suppressor of G2 allele of SKP1 [Klebsormidium nitens]|eukprot:GAQ91823.1 suppressor of G2 allele of SKP1 [Klebsormidium nitens]
MEPSNASLHTSRAGAHLMLGDLTAAIMDANKAIEIDPSMSLAYLRKGMAYFSLEDCQTAKATFEDALKLQVNHPQYETWIRKCELKLTGPAISTTGGSGASGSGQLSRNRRSSDDEAWSAEIEQAVEGVTAHAFTELDEQGVLHQEIWEHPQARIKNLGIPKYGTQPSLLLHKLPERGERGISKANELKATCDGLQSGVGPLGRTVLGLGPSGVGKTRTLHELLCELYGFYGSLSAAGEPGSRVFEAALMRFHEQFGPDFDQAARHPNPDLLASFRGQRSKDAIKFLVRILLAYALGLLAFLKRFGEAATPKKYLLFQLIGAGKQADWVLQIWELLLPLSYESVVSKLRVITDELLERTGQVYFPAAVDEAQVGLRTPGWFEGTTEGTGRPLLSALIRQLGDSVFEGYMFPFTGTGFAIASTTVLETGLAKQGRHVIFHDYGAFTGESAKAFAKEYLGRMPSGVEELWGKLVAGRYRFTVQLVNYMLEEPNMRLERAFQELRSEHTNLAGEPTSKTLMGKLRLLKANLVNADPKKYNHFTMQLRELLTDRYLLGSGTVLALQDVDLIELGFCFLRTLGNRQTMQNLWAILQEPLPAIVAREFLESEGLWNVEQAARGLMLSLPSEPSVLGLAWEWFIPLAQRAFLNQANFSSHPLIKKISNPPSCFRRKSRIVSLPGKRTSSIGIGDNYLVRHADEDYGLIEFACDPGGLTFLFPEIWAGPDLANFAYFGPELWFVMLQSRLRNELRNKMQALNTVRLRTMWGGRADKEEKREALVKALQNRNVKGILRMIVLYPGETSLNCYVETELRTSGRLEKSHAFEEVQIVIDATNAHEYFRAEDLSFVDCLKNRPALGASMVGGLEQDAMES